METLELARFFFDIGYATFMDTMFGSIVSGIMIDAFTELKEQDQEPLLRTTSSITTSIRESIFNIAMSK